MKKRYSAIFLAMAVSACSSAPKSNEVSASYVPVAQYNNYTCEQLISEAESVRRSVPALETAVDKHRSNQTGVEVVTWILFWPAAFALDKGQETSSQLAKARGEIQAIQAALMTKKCDGSALQSVSAPTGNQSQVVAAASPTESQNSAVTTKLKELDAMRKEGLINEEEYSKKRKDILDRL